MSLPWESSALQLEPALKSRPAPRLKTPNYVDSSLGRIMGIDVDVFTVNIVLLFEMWDFLGICSPCFPPFPFLPQERDPVLYFSSPTNLSISLCI